MINKYILIGFIFFINSNSFCQDYTNSDKKSYSKDSIIFLNSDSLVNFKKFKVWQPKEKHLNIVNKIIEDEINKFNAKNESQRHIDLREYYKQYVCYKDKKNHKIIYISAFCSYSFYDNIEKYHIGVTDGGKCYWQMKINISEKKVIMFHVNESI